VKNLVDAGVKPEDIAVVTPYNAQVSTCPLLLTVNTKYVRRLTSVACFDEIFEGSLSGY